MALLQPDKAIYHHPLGTITEAIKTEEWTQSGGFFSSGKVSNAIFATGSLNAFGAEAEFLSAGSATKFIVVKLSATSLVVVYRDNADSAHGTARIGTVSGTDITFGAEAEFLVTAAADHISVEALSATLFVVAYRDNTAFPFKGVAKIGTVSGTGIAFGAEAEFEFRAASGPETFLAKLSPTSFVLAFKKDVSFFGTAKIGTVSGTDITFGADAVFLSAVTVADITATVLSATSFVVVYSDTSDSSHGTAKVGTVSGTDITFGAEAEFLSGAAVSVSAAALSATLFVVVYRDLLDGGHGTAKIGTVSGTDIAFGAEAEFESIGSTLNIVTDALSATSFIVVYQSNNSGRGIARPGTVNGTTIIFDAKVEFLSVNGADDENSVAALSATKFVVAYRDGSDSDHGTAKVGSLSVGVSLTGPGASYDSVIGSTKLAYAGWMKEPSA